MAKTARKTATQPNGDANAAVLDVVTRAGKAFDKNVLSSEKAAKAFLLRTGIYTKTGRISAKYK
ncbi:MAG: hypothetical protein HY859_14855 [Caulobacterales bacterium]|nr:hypothetical protein [Caulobacterales bacterium]